MTGLPRSAVVVAARAEDAAAFSSAFEELTVLTPAAMDGALADAGCVVLSVGAAALGDVLTRVLSRIPADATILVDVTAPVAPALVADPTPLRGCAVAELVDVGDATCVRLTVDEDETAVPDLGPLQGALADVPSAGVRAVRDEYEARIAELTTSLEQARATARAAQNAARAAEAEGRRSAANPLAPVSAAIRGRRRLAAAGVAGLVVLAGISVALALVTGTGYVGGIVTAVLLVCLGNLALGWRGRRRLAGMVRRTESAVRAQQKAAQDARTRAAALDEKVTGIERNLRLVTTSSVESARSIAKLPWVGNRASLQDMHQTQAITNLYAMLPVDDAVPLMGGWAASPDVLLLLVQELRARRPSLVVECGSGVSTLWLSLAVRTWGLDTRIVALDHDARFAELTRDSLRRHGVDGIAEVRDAPLRASGLEGHPTDWYDLRALDGLEDIGLLFVDGPPEATGPRVRYPAVPMLRERFADAVTIVLDDHIRASEQEIARAWAEELPGFTVEKLPLEKGVAILRR